VLSDAPTGIVGCEAGGEVVDEDQRAVGVCLPGGIRGACDLLEQRGGGAAVLDLVEQRGGEVVSPASFMSVATPEPSMPLRLSRRPAVVMLRCRVSCLRSFVYRTVCSSRRSRGLRPGCRWSGQSAAPARRAGKLIFAVCSFGSWGSGTPPSVMYSRWPRTAVAEGEARPSALVRTAL
jgi:hypothetical protein